MFDPTQLVLGKKCKICNCFLTALMTTTTKISMLALHDIASKKKVKLFKRERKNHSYFACARKNENNVENTSNIILQSAVKLQQTFTRFCVQQQQLTCCAHRESFMIAAAMSTIFCVEKIVTTEADAEKSVVYQTVASQPRPSLGYLR